ncbi:hypothetical protein QUF63_16215 [Anaerolineales bacterium HSG25]|nr:hypothetical protein [Anaerolineales bacterium HSG25]
MHNINQLKIEIISVLDLLPVEGIKLLAEFVAFLKTKFDIQEKPTMEQTRPFGLCEGEFVVPDDFDDPLPDDILNAFEGR